MFGYVRPLRGKLSSEEQEAYQAAYCALCHALKSRCGTAARFVLNYDFVFLAMLLETEAPGERTCLRCPAHPIRGRPCLAGEGGLAVACAAEESVILAYHKLQDDARDEGFFKALGCRAAAGALGRAYRRARERQGPFDRHVRACLGELAELEAAGSPQLDRVADAFARLLSAAAPGVGDDCLDRPRQQLLYHLGRWIYLADGVDDRVEDAKKGRYNPVNARFGGQPELDYLATTMTHSLSLAQSAFQLLPANSWHSLLENILYLGLPNVQSLVLAGKWGGGEKRKRE